MVRVMSPDNTKQFRLSLSAESHHYESPPMLKSKEILMLQQCWRKAYQIGQLDMKFATKNGATRARLQLYNAVKKQKSGEDMEDLELVHAAEQLEIIWTSETSIRLQKRADNDMMQGIQRALGQSIEDFVDPAMVESSNRLLAELEGLGQPVPPAPPAPAPEVVATAAVEVVVKPDGLSPDHQDNPFYGKR